MNTLSFAVVFSIGFGVGLGLGLGAGVGAPTQPTQIIQPTQAPAPVAPAPCVPANGLCEPGRGVVPYPPGDPTPTWPVSPPLRLVSHIGAA